MATVAERKFKTLTAKKEALFKVIQKLYDLSKNLDSDTKINQFRKLYFSLEDTRKNLMEVLDELNMTMLEIDAAYSPDYNLIGTVNDMCYYIQRASKHLEKQDTDAQQQRSESTRVLPRLPNMEMPEFSGGIRDWEAFYSVFKSRVHDNKSISNDDKIDYLIGRLKGPALSVCSTVAATDFIFLFLALSKLDSETVKAFDMYMRATEVPKYADVVKFVKDQSKILFFHKPSGSSTKGRKIPSSRTFAIGQQNQMIKNKAIVSCNFCKRSGHCTAKCFKFKALTPGERYNIVRDNHWCFNCLSATHGVRSCTSSVSCTECNKKHHMLLHRSNDEPETVESEKGPDTSKNVSEEGPSNSVNFCGAISDAQENTYEANAVVDVLSGSVKNCTARFLLDSGSQSNLLTTEFCRKFGLKVKKGYSSVQGLGNSIQAVRGTTEVVIASRYDPQKIYSFSAILVDKITDQLPKIQISVDSVGNLDFADNDFGKPCKIDGIIEASIFPSILGNTHISGESGSPTVLETVFGYVIMGQVPDIGVNGTACICLSRYEETAIENIVSKFWEIEKVSKRQLLQPEELECEKFFSSSVTRDASGKFVVALPFRCSPKTLGESKFLAQSRLFSLEQRLNKDQNLRIEYNKAMQDVLDQGHMKILNENEGNRPSYYIAHHPVIKIGSSTPVRVVLDASSPTDNGVSLNDILYCGPKLQTDIVALLLNFRLFKVAVTADIRQMFRQIKVIPEHWRFQRLLWRFKPESEVQVFELTVVAFGMKCSPYLALRTVKELVNREGRNYPLASQYILRDLYMDDLVFSQDGEDEAYQVYSESIELFRRGNFDLTKWSTNSVRLLQNIPMEKRLSNMVVFKTEMKILGLQWDPQMDILSFKSKVTDEVCTKRSILSAVAQCYDPIGLLAPFILYLKLLIKKLWQLQLDWDAVPPIDICNVWENLRSEWHEIDNFQLCRHIGVKRNCPVMLLGWLNTAFLKDIFVGNRVAQLKENIPETQWRYVEGSSNPADCLSRGLTPRQLVTHSIWKSGPAWIKLPKNEWPTNKWSNLRISMPSEVLIVSNQVGTHPLLEMVERVSSWQKILRITVWVLRFLKIIETKRYISANGYRKAESVLVKLLQLKSFGKEVSSEHFSPKLRKLRPFIKNGLLKVGGRLKNSGLPYAQAHPVVLPSKETLTERIVDFYHQIYLHSGSCLLEAILRQKFWILGARSLILRRIFKCNRCFRSKPKYSRPLMADLPEPRVSQAKVFLHTGTDYFGPLLITMGKRRGAALHKAYVYLCAIHLKLVSSLSTPHFLQAFKRFLARRGQCKVLYSDQGTNYVGAKTVLRELNQFLVSSDFRHVFQEELALNGIEWHFNSPSAPHMGGLWESNVKAAKNHIHRVLGNQLLTYEEMSSLLIQVEALLNSRPLCVLSSDTNAPDALTPAHFLTLTPLLYQPKI
nr:unnamed protein product [Callosobruchus analis]